MSLGILDTSVLIDLALLEPTQLPDEQLITAITLGELTVGPLVATASEERARRQAVLQAAEHRFADAILPYDARAARVYGLVMAGELTRGRSARRRASDFQIAAISIANQLPLYTANIDDFDGIAGLDLRAVDSSST